MSAAPRGNFSGEVAVQSAETFLKWPTRRKVICWVNKSVVVHIAKSMVTASREIMSELWFLKDVMER